MKTTMTKFSVLLVLFSLFLGNLTTKAQEEDKNRECNIKYTQLKANTSSKKYDSAYEDYLWLFDNCPSYTVNTYTYGLTTLKNLYKKASADDKVKYAEKIKELYAQRLKYYTQPKYKPAKTYSDYALFVDKTGGSEEEVFNLLQKAYDIKPEKMSAKAMIKYFAGYIERNKDVDVQLLFNMNDNLQEAANKRIDETSQIVDKLREKEEKGEELSNKEKKNLKGYVKNLEKLGAIEDALSQMLEKYATCDRLIPMYEKEFSENSNNVVWLKRSVSRLYNKGCTDGTFYDKMVEKYVNADPSSNAYVFYAGMLMKKGDETKALEYFKKAVDLETDSYKKAKYLYTIAQMMKKKGRFGQARSYAYKALKARPSSGKAYLLIASMYAKSAKTCGNGVFGTRMVYQLALNFARKAKAVDPSISSIAQKHINSYKSKAPSTEDIFNEGIASGSPWKIGCWINETVRVP